ncbi:hypothetical protein H2203_004494 [Taxawa tesnikishii (nom. ined.)]|nr:hypothetical protein H2203_004494 [Dothideales sp. JES 119]
MAAVQRPTQPAQLNEPAMSPSTLLSSLLPHQIKQESQPAATTSTNVAPPTRDDDAALEFDDLPPFPSDVPTAPLLRISLSKLARGDEQEVDRLWKACYELGFFYLDLRDSRNGSGINGDQLLRDANSLFAVGEEIFALPVSEKVSKDDILGISEALPAPSVLDPHRALLKSYMTHSHAIVTLLLRHLNTRLQLPSSTLESLHRLSAVSGDQVRWVHAPPQPMDDRKTALGEHTDFGSVTVLFNRLGGLQVLPLARIGAM